MSLQPYEFTTWDPVEYRGDNYYRPSSLANNPTVKQFAPLLSADLIESATDYHVHIDLPGVSQDDLDISLTEGNLIIKAQRKEMHEVNSSTVHRIERNFGTIQRSLFIPNGVDINQAKASLEHGVLTISLPKLENISKRKLMIE